MRGIRNITPYTPGSQPNFPDMIKLNTNENAFPPSKAVEEALREFSPLELKRYSALENDALREELANKFGLEKENFLIGNGSDEVLALSFLSFFDSEFPVLFPDITYGFYKIWADLFHVPFIEIPLNRQFEIDFNDYDRENGGIILTNPNAPTGIYKELSEVIAFVKKHPNSIVIVDEAYIDFGGKSIAPYVNELDNLVVVHTLSKSLSLAGLRVGYAVANKGLISVLQAVKNSFNPYSVDMLAEKLASVAVKDQAYYQEINQKIVATREWLIQELSKIGFQTLPTKTNFVLTANDSIQMADLYHYLNEKKIFVRYFTKPERLMKYLRITIGTREEMVKVVEEIKNYQKIMPKNEQK